MIKPGRRSDTLNAVERAYKQIFNSAVNFEFLPGERINEVELATSLRMSRAPVREALNRLVTKNLVVFEAGKGFACRRLSTTEIAELYEIRSELEMSAMKEICLRATDDEISSFSRRWQNYVSQHKSIDINSLINVDEKFHLELVALAHNSERLKILKNINERIRFVRRIHITSTEQYPLFVDGHNLLLDAITKRNVEHTLKIMEKHCEVDLPALKAHVYEGLARIYADEVI